jgi:hypothetical protein
VTDAGPNVQYVPSNMSADPIGADPSLESSVIFRRDDASPIICSLRAVLMSCLILNDISLFSTTYLLEILNF